MAGEPTPSQTVGPFFGFALPFEGDDAAAEQTVPGSIRIEGEVRDGEGAPVPDALIEVWQGESFGRCRTDPEGAFHFVVRKPDPIKGPDGHVQAPHLHVNVFARGLLRHLLTRMYFPDEQAANARDPLLTSIEDPIARSTLVARDDGGVLRFDVNLQGERETVFFAL
jgi:protocatechuate 3,4-dioxygenase alpha subunit